MTKQQDTLEKAYGSIPKDYPNPFDFFDWLPTPRGIKYYWIKLVRRFTR